jgi:hypothetical protein
MGIAVEEVQRFHYAAKLSGDSLGAVDSMLQKLTLSMGEARNATSTQAAAFAEMGIDPSGKSTSEVFLELATTLTTMGDKQKAASLATDILGKSYKDSLPYMQDYIKNQKEIAEQEVFTRAQEESLQRGKEAFDKIGASAEGFAGWLAIGVVEGLEEMSFLLQNGQSSIMAARGKGVDDFGSGATSTWSPDKIQTGIIDPYQGWTAAEVELQVQTDKVTQAQKDLENAMAIGETNNPEHIAAVKDLSAAYVEQKQILTDLIGLVDTAANTSINPYYDPGAIENQGPSTAAERAAAMAGINYGSGANVGYYEGAYADNTSRYKSNLAFARADTSGNASLQAILALESNRFTPVGNELNANYGYGSGTFASTSDDYMAAYRESQNPTVVVQVSPDFSESAQSIAEKTAEAISRELARQASGS